MVEWFLNNFISIVLIKLILGGNESWYGQLSFDVLDDLLTAVDGDLSAGLLNVIINNYSIIFISLVCVDIGCNIGGTIK